MSGGAACELCMCVCVCSPPSVAECGVDMSPAPPVLSVAPPGILLAGVSLLLVCGAGCCCCCWSLGSRLLPTPTMTDVVLSSSLSSARASSPPFSSATHFSSSSLLCGSCCLSHLACGASTSPPPSAPPASRDGGVPSWPSLASLSLLSPIVSGSMLISRITSLSCARVNLCLSTSRWPYAPSSVMLLVILVRERQEAGSSRAGHEQQHASYVSISAHSIVATPGHVCLSSTNHDMRTSSRHHEPWHTASCRHTIQRAAAIPGITAG